MTSAVLSLSSLVWLAAFLRLVFAVNFTLVKDYSGPGFFDSWDFPGGYDNTTGGDVFWVTQQNSASLAYVDSSNHVIIKVDNTSVVSTYPYLEKRNSVRINSKDLYGVGTVWVIDALHVPFGCSVWPAIWTTGTNWPDQGEIDIVESINTLTYNQMALHTAQGCMAASGTDETGTLTEPNCNATENRGCTVMENKPNSFGQGFADNGGGVWAAQFDISGIYIWFWSRKDVPASITTATDSLDISTWGAPSAAYPNSGCDIATYFGAQQLVIDITLCGSRAGDPQTFAQQCGGNASDPNSCYTKCVAGAGTSDLAKAYFELNYIRAFTINNASAESGNGSAVPSDSHSAGPPTTSSSPSGASTESNNAPLAVSLNRPYAVIAAVSLFSWALM